ncbi:MAG TPA: hypothetical protein VM287_08265, partial [Egibacteraceae bacterium]|nr:hypothetical protein [Egibacteraceae bacterium]
MERARLNQSTTLRKPGVKQDFARAIAATVQPRSVGMAFEGEARHFSGSRLHADFAKVRVHVDDQADRFAAALDAPPSPTWMRSRGDGQGGSATESTLVLGPLGPGSSRASGRGSAFAQTPNEAVPTAARVPAAFRPGEEESECAACQAGGKVTESCPDCAKAAEHAGRPLQASDDERVGSAGPEPDKDEPAQCEHCALGETTGELFKDRGSGPRESGWTTSSDTDVRPMEAGWWTSRTPTSNTIGCDGSGSLVVMQNGPTYLHGVTDCTIKHEQVHANDWLGRYGNGICKGRARGDLPYYDPPGKDAYETFLNKSECRAWVVGETCRKEKLSACKTDACKEYVQEHVDFAGKMVKKYCGRSAGAKAAIGAFGGAAVGAGIG